MKTVAVIGSGSWGTALAVQLKRAGNNVILWSFKEEEAQAILLNGENKEFLPGVKIDKEINVTYKDEDVAWADMLIFATPSKFVRNMAKRFAPYVRKDEIIVNVAKGLEESTLMRLSEVIKEEIPQCRIGCLSGPSHAEETIVRDITLITAASKDLEAARYVQGIFSNSYFRLYTNSDVIGVETAGALKNIIAVGAGALHGMGYGDNAKAAVITRGLAEITRLGVKLGADPLTYSGLSGVGDLIVTGTSIHSRNWRAGDALGRGEKLEDIERNMGMVIEGISTTKVAYEIAQELGVYMPITTAIYKSIYEGADIKESILNMMSNELRSENEWDKNKNLRSSHEESKS